MDIHGGLAAARTTANAPQANQRPPDFSSLLPATYRFKLNDVDQIGSPTNVKEFFAHELAVPRLNRIHGWLWLTGRPMPPRPLHYQKAIGRDFVLHEQVDMHLVTDDVRLFIKPIPRYLFDVDFWRESFTCERDCACQPDNPDARGIPGAKPATAERQICEKHELYQSALGFMLSYASLISYESDFHISRDAKLVPVGLTWPDWRTLVKELLSDENKHHVNKRYNYGELRLDRLNLVYRYTFRAPLRGYFHKYSSYNQYWQGNLAIIIAILGYVAIVLTAMQVGLATTRLQPNRSFQRACYGFTVFSILFPLVLVGLLSITFLIRFLANFVATHTYYKKRFATEPARP